MPSGIVASTRMPRAASCLVSDGPLLDPVLAARGEHDQLMAHARQHLDLAIDIGAHAAAGRRVDLVDVDDPHHSSLVGEKPPRPCRYCIWTVRSAVAVPTSTSA